MIDSQNFKWIDATFLNPSAAFSSVTLESKRIAGLAPLTLMPAAGRLTLLMNRNWRSAPRAWGFASLHPGFMLSPAPQSKKYLVRKN